MAFFFLLSSTFRWVRILGLVSLSVDVSDHLSQGPVQFFHLFGHSLEMSGVRLYATHVGEMNQFLGSFFSEMVGLGRSENQRSP